MHQMTPRQARRHSVAVAAAAAALVLALGAGVGRADPLPTTLPTEATTRIEYGSDGYTGTIPTQVRLVDARALLCRGAWGGGASPAWLPCQKRGPSVATHAYTPSLAPRSSDLVRGDVYKF